MRTNRSTNKLRYSKLHKIAYIFLFVFLFLGLGSGIFLFSIREKDADAASYPAEFSFRDDYFVNLTDQSQFGTCYAYANIKSIENFLAKTTGEHFEISESYVALTNLTSQIKYLVGDGGSVRDVAKAFNQYGFVLDSDFSYDDLYFVNKENSDFFLSSLQKEADKTTVSIMSDIKSYSYQSNTQIIKYYITEYGNASINIDEWDVKENNGKDELVVGSTGGHALSVLGWDDNYVASNGSKGAYLILNSYGDYDTDGIVYLPYSTAVKSKVFAFAYQISLPVDYVYLNSNANYKTDLKGKYYASTNYIGSQTTLKEKNIFDVNDDFDLDYSFPEKNDLTYNVSIFRGDVEVSDDFAILKDDTHCYVRKKKALESGSYKLKFTYSYTQNGKTINRSILKQLFLMDGLEVIGFDKINEENGYRDYVTADSFSMTDNNIYVTQYGTNIAGMTEIGMIFSPYSNCTSYSLTKNGSVVGRNYSTTNRNRRITLSIASSFIANGENLFVLTLGNNKNTKTYNLYIYKDNNYSYLGEGRKNSKFSTLVKIDLDGGLLKGNYQNKYLISPTQTFARHHLESPYKDGYLFLKYQYLMDGNWTDLPYDMARQQYFITSAYVRHATAENSYTNSLLCYNYFNSVLVRAVYQESPNPISIIRNGNDADTFNLGEDILLNLTIANATDVVWLLDDQQIGTGTSYTIKGLKSGSYKVSVQFKIDSTDYSFTKKLFVKYHLYIVKVVEDLNANPFVYNKSLQKPTIVIDGLEEGKDYTIEYPNSINAGDYKAVIIPDESVLLDRVTIDYTIQKLTLTGSVKPKIIRQGEAIDDFEYEIEGWIEDEKPIVKFDSTGINNYNIGEYNLPISFENPQIISYDYSEIKDAVLVIVETDFDADSVNLITANANQEKITTFKYGQPIVLRYDRPSGMFENAEYYINGEIYTNKIQYITKRLPVGHYTVTSKAKIIDGKTISGETIERETEFDVVKLDIKIVVQNTEGIKGNNPSNLKYNIISDYEVDGLNISLRVVDFDKSKLGEYQITADVTGSTENYNIEIVNGTYTLKENPQFITNIVLISVFSVLLLLIIIFYIIRRRKRNKHINTMSNS